jgi:hypothetical protein
MSVPMKVIARIVAAPLLLLSLGVMAQPAAAGTRIPLTGNVFNFDAGVICVFPLQATETSHEILTILPGGRAYVTGNYSIEFVNLDNGRSLTVHAPGPIMFSAAGPGVAPGPQVLIVTAAEFGGPGIFLYTGRIVVTRDDAGGIGNVQSVGTRSANLCDQIR